MIAFVQNFTKAEKVADYSDTIFGDGAASFYGKPIPISTGTRRLTGVCLWASEFRTYSNKVPSKVPFYFNSKINGYTTDVLTDPPDTNIYADFAFGFGRRGSESADADTKITVLRVWANGILIYDKKITTNEAYNGSLTDKAIERFPIDFKVYPGSEDQLPDPTIVEAEGVQNTPAFRGMIYVVFKDFPISKVGNGMPTIKIEMADRATGTNVVSNFTKTNPDEIYGSPMTVNWESGKFTLWSPTEAVTFSIATLKELSRSTLDPVFQALWDAEAKDFILSERSLTTFKYNGQFRSIIRGATTTINQIVYLVDFEKGILYDSIGPIDQYGNAITGYESAVFLQATENLQEDCLLVLGGRLFGGDEIIVLRYDPYSDKLRFAYGRSDATRTRGLGSINALGSGNGLKAIENFGGGVDFWGGAGSNVIRAWAGYNIDGNLNKTGDGVDKNKFSFYSYYNFATYNDPAFTYIVQAVWRDTTDGNLIVWVDRSRIEYFEYNTLIYKIRTGEGLVFSAGFIEILDADKIIWSCVTSKDTIDGTDYAIQPPFNNQARLLISRASLISWTKGDNYYVLNTQAGTCTRTATRPASTQSDGTTFPSPNAQYSFADPGIDAIYSAFAITNPIELSAKYRPARILIGQTFSDQVPLSNLLYWYGRAAGYLDSDIEVSGIDDQITGAIITQRISLSDLFNQIKGAFNFDKYESGGKIRLTRNVPGETVVFDAELDGGRLAAIDGEGGNEYLTTTVRDERDIPSGVEIRYLDEDADYAIGVQRAKRTKFPVATTDSDEYTSYTVPIIMKANEALGYANRALWAYASEKLSQNFRYPSELINLEPSRIIKLTQNEREYALKLSEVMINGDYTLSCVARTLTITVDRDYVASLPIRPPLAIGYEGFGTPIIMDVPGIEGDLVSSSIVYGYAAGPADTLAVWRGATVYDVTTGGQVALAKVFTTPVRGSLAALFDENSTSITFKLIIGNQAQFVVQDDETALSGGILLAVGQAGRWELMSWRTVSYDEGSQLITLGDLVRSFRGTEINKTKHNSGDQVILFNQADYELIEVNADQIGSIRRYGAARTLAGLNGAPIVSYLINGTAQAPFSPAAFQAKYSGANIVFSWQRRDRLNENDFLDGNDNVANSEGFEGYRLRIYNQDGVLVRENSLLVTNTYTYLNADIITDFGSMPTSITAEIAQKGARIPFGVPNNRTMAIYS